MTRQFHEWDMEWSCKFHELLVRGVWMVMRVPQVVSEGGMGETQEVHHLLMRKTWDGHEKSHGRFS